MPKIYTEKENTMSVIIKFNGFYIGETTMTKEEVRNAENAGFTILTRKEQKGE